MAQAGRNPSGQNLGPLPRRRDVHLRQSEQTGNHKPARLSRKCRFIRKQQEAARAPHATKPSGFPALSTPFFHSFASRTKRVGNPTTCLPPMTKSGGERLYALNILYVLIAASSSHLAKAGSLHIENSVSLMRPKIKQKSLYSPSIRSFKCRVIRAKIVSSPLLLKVDVPKSCTSVRLS